MSAKQAFLDSYEQEHAITMKVLRAFPADKTELQPHPRSKTARELAWVFVMERALGTAVLRNEMATRPPSGKPPAAPAWPEVLAALEKAHTEFSAVVQGYSEDELQQTVKFMVGPRTMGDWVRMQFLWFLLHDQIHHRGQFSIYLRMADAKVPSIYGPSGDEPWM